MHSNARSPTWVRRCSTHQRRNVTAECLRGFCQVVHCNRTRCWSVVTARSFGRLPLAKQKDPESLWTYSSGSGRAQWWRCGSKCRSGPGCSGASWSTPTYSSCSSSHFTSCECKKECATRSLDRSLPALHRSSDRDSLSDADRKGNAYTTRQVHHDDRSIQ